MADDRDEYWRAPMQGSDWSQTKAMLRSLRQGSKSITLPSLAPPRPPRPRLPTVEDYVGLGVPREVAERAVQSRSGKTTRK
jgi:hypothetical protein